MDEISALFHGFSVALTPFNVLLMLVGISLGVIIGVLPGLGGANGIAILLPLTFTMPPTSAIIMLSCIYWGALFGGAITSVLLIFQVSLGLLQQPLMGTPWLEMAVLQKH